MTCRDIYVDIGGGYMLQPSIVGLNAGLNGSLSKYWPNFKVFFFLDLIKIETFDKNSVARVSYRYLKLSKYSIKVIAWFSI